jgi:hypothetical protein
MADSCTAGRSLLVNVGVVVRVICGSFRVADGVLRQFPQLSVPGRSRGASSGRCVRSYSRPRWSRPINGLPSSSPISAARRPTVPISKIGGSSPAFHSGSVRQRRPGRLAHVDVSPSALIRRPSLSGTSELDDRGRNLIRRAALRYCVHRKLQTSAISPICKSGMGDQSQGRPERKETW